MGEGLETKEEDLWSSRFRRPKQRPTLPIDHRHDDNRRWEAGIHIDILEFHSSLQPEEFLDWIAQVDDILNFKEVSENHKV